VALDAILESIRPNGKVPHDQAALSGDRAATKVITPNGKTDKAEKASGAKNSPTGKDE
jgi:hypothetical protein